MRMQCVALLLGLTVLACLHTSTMANNGKEPKECCFNFFTKPIPLTSIVSYEETRPDCPKAGVVFVTKKAARVCADPGFRWVQRAMDKIDLSTIEGSA